MKLADFFLGIRQLFGILIPGVIWLICIVLGVSRQDPVQAMNALTMRELIAALAFGFIIGITVRRISFRIGVATGRLFHLGWSTLTGMWTAARKALRKRKEQPSTDATGQQVTATAGDAIADVKAPQAKESRRTRLRRILTELQAPETGEVYERFKELAQEQLEQRYRTTQSTQWEKLTEEDRGYLYKYLVLSEEDLARKVEENEAEINLYSSLILPLIAFELSLRAYWCGPNAQRFGFLGSAYQNWWTFGTLVAVFLLAWRIQPRRTEEAAEWYRMFLATELRSHRQR
jgi:hypothetical protein